MKELNSNSQDSSLPPDFVKLINEVNLNSEKTKETFIKLQDFTYRRDHLLRCLLANLNLLQMNCLKDVIKLDDSGMKNFDEIVKKPIDELEDMVKGYLDGRSDVFQVHFQKILEFTQEILERTSAFKLSSLDQRRAQLDSIFRLPDADKD